MNLTIAIEWKNGRPRGHVELLCGRLGKVSAVKGKGKITGNTFSFSSDGACRLRIVVDGARTKPGSDATIITVRTRANPFSFFLRDVTRDNPIVIPSIGVAVTTATDRRSYDEIEETIQTRGLQTNLQRIESQPEEHFANAAEHVRDMQCETWLGLSRDMRIFAMNFRSMAHRWDWIQPRFHYMNVQTPETPEKPDKSPHFLKYGFMMPTTEARKASPPASAGRQSAHGQRRDLLRGS